MSPSCWTKVGEIEITRLDIVMEITRKIKVIQDHLKIAQDWQKSYADANRRELDFKEDNWIFLKNLANEGVLRFGKRGKIKSMLYGDHL